VSDGAGGAIIFYTDERSGHEDIYAQHLNASGNPCWQAGGVPICTTPADKGFRAVPGGGGALIVWDEIRAPATNYDVYVQSVGLDGVVQFGPNGKLLCGSNPSGVNRTSPDLATFLGLGAVITWTDGRNGPGDIYALAVLGDATPMPAFPADGIPITTAAGIQDLPKVTRSDNGSTPGYIISWADRHDGAFRYDIYAQRLQMNLNQGFDAMWGPGGIKLNPVEFAAAPLFRVTSDGNAGAIISWENYDLFPAVPLVAQRISSSGTVMWLAGGVRLCNSSGGQFDHDAVVDSVGGAMFVWEDRRSGESDIYAQRINQNGSLLWGQRGVPVCTADSIQYGPTIVTDGASGAIVAWGGGRLNPTEADVNLRGITAQGLLVGPSSSLPIATVPTSGGQAWISMIAAGPGSAIVAWGDTRNSPNDDVYANLATLQGQPLPGVVYSYFVPQSGSLTTPTEGANAMKNFRTCPNVDGTQVLKLNARLKVVLRTEDNTPLLGITPANICMLFNGGWPVQGFTGVGDDSIVANYQYNELANCPDVRCIQADASTDSTGSTFITLLGATPGSPGVGTRDPYRKWGRYAGDVPIRALGV